MRREIERAGFEEKQSPMRLICTAAALLLGVAVGPSEGVGAAARGRAVAYEEGVDDLQEAALEAASLEKSARLRTTRQRVRVPCTSNESAEEALAAAAADDDNDDDKEEGAFPTMRTAKILLNSS